MNKHMFCTHCGYDLSASEYISNTAYSSVSSQAGLVYTNSVLSDVNTQLSNEVICPCCKSIKSYTT